MNSLQISDKSYDTLPLLSFTFVTMCWGRNGSKSLINSRQSRKSSFNLDTNNWLPPLNGRPILDKNFTRHTTLVNISFLPGVGFEFNWWYWMISAMTKITTNNTRRSTIHRFNMECEIIFILHFFTRVRLLNKTWMLLIIHLEKVGLTLK